MRKYLLVFLCVLMAGITAYAQNVRDPEVITVVARAPRDTIPASPVVKPWMITVSGGRSFAFGDDSWNIKHDREYAQGTAVSAAFGRHFSRLFAANFRVRYLELKSRVNLEVMDAFKDKYPDFFPNSGFYKYHGLAFQAEGMFNVTALIPKFPTKYLNLYLLGGVGVNTMFAYDENVGNWDGSYEGLIYNVDTRTHTMPLGCVGGVIDFRVSSELSVNFEAIGTFTGDKMEGVAYEEPYDVYVTLAIGATLHF